MSSLQPSLRSVNDIDSKWFESPLLEIANGPNCIDMHSPTLLKKNGKELIQDVFV